MNLLFGVIFVTLTLGTHLSYRADATLLKFHALYYGLCFLVLTLLKLGDDFFRTFEANRNFGIEKKIIITGVEVDAYTLENQQDDRFLDTFDVGVRTKRKLIAWFFFLTSIWFFYVYQRLEFSLVSVIPLVTCFFILSSLFVGHLLIPLMLNVLSVIAVSQGAPPLVLLLLYVGLVLTSLSLIGHSFNVAEKLKKRGLTQQALVALALIAVGYFALSSSLTQIFERAPEAPQVQPSPAVRRFAQDHADKLSKLQERLTQIKGDGFNPKVDSLSWAIRAQEKRLEAWAKSAPEKVTTSASALEQQEKLRQLLQNSRELEQQLEALQSATQQAQLDDEKILEQKLSSGQTLSQSELENFQRKMQTVPSATRAWSDAIQEKSLQGTLTPQDLKEMQEKFEEFKKLTAQAKVEKLPSTPVMDDVSQSEIESIIPPRKDTDYWASLFKKAKPFLVILGGFFVFNYFFRKKGIKRIVSQNPEALPELRTKWRALKAARLSPREEIIQSYNLLHDSLQRIQYVEQETPPSCIVYDDVRDQHASLEQAALAVTDSFARCFYGEKDVRKPELVAFRKSLQLVLKTYQLR